MATLSGFAHDDLGKPWYLRVDGPEPLAALGRVPRSSDRVVSASTLQQVQEKADSTGCLLLPNVIVGRSQLAATLRWLIDEGFPGRVLLAVDPGSGASDPAGEIVTPHQVTELLPRGAHIEHLELLDYLLVLTIAGDASSGQLDDRTHLELVASVQEQLLRQRDESLLLTRRRLTRVITGRPDHDSTDAPFEAAALIAEVDRIVQRFADGDRLVAELDVLRTKYDRLRQRRVVRAADRVGRIIRRARSRVTSA